jgi:hypothetical protein
MKNQRPTVKAREHQGTRSLSLTVPAIFRTKYNVQTGDVFEVSASISDNELKVTYKRVYSQPRT